MVRTGREVATEAIICGALGFRASLEVTEHPRTIEFCSQLLPWLDQIGIGDKVEPFHREILECSHGNLPPDFQSEAYWRGESASIFGWSIQLFDTPDRLAPVDPGLLVKNLRILQPTASQVLSGATFRSKIEIEEYCAYCLEVRNQFQLLSLPLESQLILKNIHCKRMAELGLSDGFRKSNAFDEEVAKLLPTLTGAKGLYVVRAMAAEWLLEQH